MPSGDGVEQLKWRLENGELPPLVPPKVIVLAVGTNSKGMVSGLTCSNRDQLILECHHLARGSAN